MIWCQKKDIFQLDYISRSMLYLGVHTSLIHHQEGNTNNTNHMQLKSVTSDTLKFLRGLAMEIGLCHIKISILI